MLEPYLRELERELARTLPPEDVALRLAEAEAHLREGIAGRVEIGLSPEDAERQAVAAFGPIHTALPSTDSKGFWLVLAGAGLVGHYLSVRYVIGHVPALAAAIVLVQDALIVLAILGFARACFRSRRPGAPSLLLAVFLAFALPVGYVQGRAAGGFGEGFRRTFVDAPARAFEGTPLKGAIDAAYEWRFVLWVPVALAAIDLTAAGAGALAASIRRRRRVRG